jgi:hypothetical protein
MLSHIAFKQIMVTAINPGTQLNQYMLMEKAATGFAAIYQRHMAVLPINRMQSLLLRRIVFDIGNRLFERMHRFNRMRGGQASHRASIGTRCRRGNTGHKAHGNSFTNKLHLNYRQ